MKQPIRSPEPIPDLPPPPEPMCETSVAKECPWNADMSAAPKDGRTILLTEKLENEDGVRSYWYVSLGEARPWKAAPRGWLNADTKKWLAFEPAGWAYVARAW